MHAGSSENEGQHIWMFQLKLQDATGTLSANVYGPDGDTFFTVIKVLLKPKRQSRLCYRALTWNPMVWKASQGSSQAAAVGYVDTCHDLTQVSRKTRLCQQCHRWTLCREESSGRR